jgi:hypothetical protein
VVGALEDEEEDEVGELEDGDEMGAVGLVVGALEDEDNPDEVEVGAAALRLELDIKDSGPELKRITEREITTTRDKISVFLLIVTLLLLLLFLLSLLLSVPSSGPVNY